MKAIVNGAEVGLVNTENKWFPDSPGQYSMEYVGDGKLLIQVDGRTFNTTLLEINRAEKSLVILINGQKQQVQIKEPLDELLHSMGLDKIVDAGASNIKAPMPGLVLDVLVSQGDTVAKGDKVLVLEAMKMENIIKASGDGVVARILVNKGETVDKNQVLIEFS